MQNWKEWKIGDQIKWSWNEFDGKGSMIGTLTEVYDDHAIMVAEGLDIWIDDCFSDMFEKISK